MRTERGFSLVEVLLASGIITTVLVSVSGLFILAMKTNAASGDQTQCVALAQERLEKLKHQSFDTIPLGGSLETCESGFCESIDVDSKGRAEFRLNWSVGTATAITASLPAANVLRLDVRCTSLRSREGQPGAPKTITLATYRTPTVSE